MQFDHSLFNFFTSFDGIVGIDVIRPRASESDDEYLREQCAGYFDDRTKQVVVILQNGVVEYSVKKIGALIALYRTTQISKVVAIPQKLFHQPILEHY